MSDLEGLSFQTLTQSIHANRAKKLKERPLAVFKATNGVILHDDLADVRDDQHHVKTTSFTELTDEATDAHHSRPAVLAAFNTTGPLTKSTTNDVDNDATKVLVMFSGSGNSSGAPSNQFIEVPD